LPVEKKGGALVYAKKDAQEIMFALVHDVFGYWTISKGSIEDGEVKTKKSDNQRNKRRNWT
jgi:hypothetical protein